ncbi:unnamed protein product [Gadus morhua 'NCC']
MLRHVDGTYIAITDGGFFMNLTVMLLNVVTDDFWSDAQYGAVQARAIMERVFLSFKERVKALGPKDKGRATVRKNNIYDFSKWDVLPQDQRFLLGILDEAIAGETENQDFQILKTLSRFGQKSEEPWYCEAGLAAELSSVLKAPNVLFLQLYTDSPHRKLSRAFRHPLVGQMSMRLEQVCKFRAGVERVPVSLEPQSLFGMEELRCLLRTSPLVVPFKDTADGSGVAELALEEVFWGHPLCQEDGVYSVSLGTASTDANPLTHYRGFPAQALPSAAAAGIEPPPLRNWTGDREQAERIQRLFRFCESIEGTVPVLGGALWMIFLEDWLGALQGPQPPGKVAMSVEVEKVTEDLATRDSFRHPSAFGRAREVAKAKGHDIKDLLTQGLDQLDLKFLPHYTLRDIRKRKVLSWEDGRFVEVLRPGQKPCDESWAAGLTEAVCREIEARKTSRLLATNCTIQSDKGTRFGLRREVVPLLWSSGKTSRALAPNRTTQSDYGTHFGLRRDVVPLLWSYRKTSRPLAPNRTTQPDYGTHFGLRRDVVPLLWSYRKTSRPLAPNRTIQSD